MKSSKSLFETLLDSTPMHFMIEIALLVKAFLLIRFITKYIDFTHQQYTVAGEHQKMAKALRCVDTNQKQS